MTADGTSELAYSQWVVVHASPEAVYDLVSDVTRTGRWSPVCTACWWDEGAGPRAGSWFTGRNEVRGRRWETRSQVVAAERGREFAFVVGGTYVRWGFTMAAVPEGTRLTESWQFLPDGVAMFHERFGDDAPAQIRDRTRQAHDGIPRTLEAVKQLVEDRGGSGGELPD